MSNLVEIKKRIESISSTIKVTKVMQMIATAKIAKIKTKMASVEKYDKYVNDILRDYLNNTNQKLEFNRYLDVYVADKKEQKHILYILFSSDKGTCGSINTNVFKEINLIIKNCGENAVITVLPIGKKAVKFCDTYSKKYGFAVFQQEQQFDAEYCDGKMVNNVVAKIINSFEKNEFDEIHLLYHKFKNIITCNVVNEKLMPFGALSLENNKQSEENEKCINILESEKTLSAIVEFFVRTKIYNAYISNIASIVSSRMNAMDNATKNGQAIIDELRIKYNKGRQANITSELSDIVSGFEAIS